MYKTHNQKECSSTLMILKQHPIDNINELLIKIKIYNLKLKLACKLDWI